MLAEAAFKVARLYVHLSHHRRKKEAEAEAAMSEAEQAMAATATEVDPSPSRWRQLRHRAPQRARLLGVSAEQVVEAVPKSGIVQARILLHLVRAQKRGDSNWREH